MCFFPLFFSFMQSHWCISKNEAILKAIFFFFWLYGYSFRARGSHGPANAAGRARSDGRFRKQVHMRGEESPANSDGLKIQKGRGLNYGLDAIKDLNYIHLIIAGVGQDLNLIGEYSKKDPEKIQYLGVLIYDEVIDKTLKADMLFAFNDPAIPHNRYASPKKQFESIMCGKPIITNNGTSMAEIVRKENCGHLVPNGDVNALKHAIITLKDDPELCWQPGAHGRKAYEQR